MVWSQQAETPESGASAGRVSRRQGAVRLDGVRRRRMSERPAQRETSDVASTHAEHRHCTWGFVTSSGLSTLCLTMLNLGETRLKLFKNYDPHEIQPPVANFDFF